LEVAQDSPLYEKLQVEEGIKSGAVTLVSADGEAGSMKASVALEEAVCFYEVT
jgi:hypothetical protein